MRSERTKSDLTLISSRGHVNVLEKMVIDPKRRSENSVALCARVFPVLTEVLNVRSIWVRRFVPLLVLALSGLAADQVIMRAQGRISLPTASSYVRSVQFLPDTPDMRILNAKYPKAVEKKIIGWLSNSEPIHLYNPFMKFIGIQYAFMGPSILQIKFDRYNWVHLLCASYLTQTPMSGGFYNTQLHYVRNTVLVITNKGSEYVKDPHLYEWLQSGWKQDF